MTEAEFRRRAEDILRQECNDANKAKLLMLLGEAYASVGLKRGVEIYKEVLLERKAALEAEAAKLGFSLLDTINGPTIFN